jgi:hypothetical protein
MSNNKPEENVQRMKYCLEELFSRECSTLWKHGYACSAILPAYYAVCLDNHLKPSLQKHNTIEQVFSHCHKVSELVTALQNSSELCDNLILYIEQSIASIDSSNTTEEKLSQLMLDLQKLDQFIIFNPYIQNPLPKSADTSISLDMALHNPFHTIRWKTCKNWYEGGRDLVVLSQWYPDVEAILKLFHFILSESVPLKTMIPPSELLPFHSKRKVELGTNWELYQTQILDPIKRLKRPVSSNQDFHRVIECVLDIDTAKITAQKSLYTKFTSFLEKQKNEQFKQHLFLSPFYMDDPRLPADFTAPAPIINTVLLRNPPKGKTVHKKEFIDHIDDLINLALGAASNLSAARYKATLSSLGERILSFSIGRSRVSSKKAQPKRTIIPNYSPGKPSEAAKHLASTLLAESPASLTRSNDNPKTLQTIFRQIPWQKHPERALFLVDTICTIDGVASGKTKDALFKQLNSYFTQGNDEEIAKLIHRFTSLLEQMTPEQYKQWKYNSHTQEDFQDFINEEYCKIQAEHAFTTMEIPKQPQERKLLKLNILENHYHEIEMNALPSLLNQTVQSEQSKATVQTVFDTTVEHLFECFSKVTHHTAEQKMKYLLSSLKEHNRENGQQTPQLQNWLHSAIPYLRAKQTENYNFFLGDIQEQFTTVWKIIEQKVD